MRGNNNSGKARTSEVTRRNEAIEGVIAEEISSVKKDITSLLDSFRGAEGLMTGGGSNYLKKMRMFDDHLNSLKFLESGIQEEKIGKDDYGSQIGLFNFASIRK